LITRVWGYRWSIGITVLVAAGPLCIGRKGLGAKVVR